MVRTLWQHRLEAPVRWPGTNVRDSASLAPPCVPWLAARASLSVFYSQNELFV